MRKSLSIALIAVLQGIRAQTFWIAGLLWASLLGMTFLLRVLAVGEKSVILRSLCLSSMEISAVLLIVFGFTHGFYRDRDSRLQSIYLTHVSKAQYLLGKLLGCCLLILFYVLLTLLLSSPLLYAQGALTWSFFLGGYSILLKLSILSGFCLFYSCLFSSSVLASLLTVFTAVASEFAVHALSLMSRTESEIIRMFYRTIYHLLPNADRLDLKYQAIYEKTVPSWYLGEISLYALAYTAMLYILALWLFKRQEH